MLITWILFPLLSYLAGAIPFGLIISHRIAQIDITLKGSGNIGATNVAREVGIKWGFLTLAFDLLKGFLPLYIALNCFSSKNDFLLISISIAVLLGHRFSPFLEFKGGKGVATAFGIFIALSPLSAMLSLCVFIIIVYFSDYISLGSIIAACIMPIILCLLNKQPALIITALLTAFIILLTHSGNIIRIINRKERSWKNRRSGKDIK